MAPPDDEISALAEELRSVVSHFSRSVRARTGTPSTARSEALTLLERQPRNVAALAQRRNVTHQTMRQTVAQLADEGLVTRSADPRDRRSQVVTITARGRLWLVASREARTRDIAAMLRTALSARERRTLRSAIAVLERLNDAYRREVDIGIPPPAGRTREP